MLTNEQEERISECDVLLQERGLRIYTVIEIDEEGQDIGTPIPPKK